MPHADDYFAEKYGLTLPHSELRALQPQLPHGHALDVGCGRGRNSLFLADYGFTVDAYDVNSHSIDSLRQTAAAENLIGIHAHARDFNQDTDFGQPDKYAVALSTVVMMFLQPATIPALIGSMQTATHPGGYNLIVSAMSTDDMPCPVDFPFTFQSGELPRYYADWHIHKYNEDIGQLHRTDEHGNRISLRFATLWAQKI